MFAFAFSQYQDAHTELANVSFLDFEALDPATVLAQIDSVRNGFNDMLC